MVEMDRVQALGCGRQLASFFYVIECCWMDESGYVDIVSQEQLFKNADLQVRRRRLLCPGFRVLLSTCPR